ncbi:hypothetical protein RB195_005415 [Necator americanus]|uniref:Reverse transcriptase domain-containing protein n=2 Tax=Necator americanus TaxID=51031 RepID=A0ABR1BQY9_NECAM
MNQRTTAAVRTPAGCTTPFEVLTGVRQGAVAGPFLFNSAIDDEYAADVVIFVESSTKLQHVVNLVSNLAAYGLRLRPVKCEQMWISPRPRRGIRVDGQPIELVDEFCYLGFTLKNNGSYERDVQQRCAMATSAFNSKCLWSTPLTHEIKLRPADRLVKRVLRSLSGSSWKKPPGRKRKFWTEMVKKELRTLAVARQFRRDVEKVGQGCVQGRQTSAKMRVIAPGDDISPPIKSKIDLQEVMWRQLRGRRSSDIQRVSQREYVHIVIRRHMACWMTLFVLK